MLGNAPHPKWSGSTQGGRVLSKASANPSSFFSSWFFFFCSLGDISRIPGPAPGTRCLPLSGA